MPWLDSFNPKTGEWRKLADAPRPRDHFQAVVLDGKMYAVAGRRSAAATGDALNLTTPEIDIYEFASGTWSTLPAAANIPTQRAGVSTVLLNGQIIVIGGESPIAERMHTDVESFNPKTHAVDDAGAAEPRPSWNGSDRSPRQDLHRRRIVPASSW